MPVHMTTLYKIPGHTKPQMLAQVPEGEPHSTLVRMCRISSAPARPVFCVLRRNADNTVSGAIGFRTEDSRHFGRCADPQQ
jgi:hypothetical protein